MDVVLQLSLLTVSVCLGAAALVWRTAGRSDSPARIDVDPVSRTWLADFKVRGRSEYRTE
jgi:hypothetical protein